MADESEDFGIQQSLNKLLEDRKRIARETAKILQEQASLTNEILNTLNDVKLRDGVIQQTRDLKGTLEGAGRAAKNFAQQNRDLSGVMNETLQEANDGFDGLLKTYGKAIGKAGKWGAATGGFVEGIIDGVNILKTGLSGVISLASSVVSGMFSIGKSILSIPFKIFNAFVAEANRMQGEPLLAREFEEVRKSFGDFGEDLSKNVIKGYRKLRGELAETGLSNFRVLGMLHERLKFIREMFEELGAVAHSFAEEMAFNAERMAAFQKGLGLSGEMMKGLAQITQGTGETLEETLRTSAKFTTDLGKQFNISQKVIGRDIGEMSKDLKIFGSVGIRQMAQLSVFARKLGADFKDLLGIVDRFDNFEDAADSAARLAQAFGLNVDVMKMINAQDPGERIDMLRQAFFRAGKDITKLSRQERNYLAQTAGIEDQALNAVFALENQAKTYGEIASAGQTSEQQAITQAEAMKRLSDSIERMIKSGSRTGGFFDRFALGLRKGIRYSFDFRTIMRYIRKDLWAAERAGRAVGRAFVNAFPGIKDFLEGVKEFFQPRKFRALARSVVGVFSQFFKDLGNPKTAEQALGNLLKGLQKAFFGMENSQRSAMSKIVEGLKKAFKAVGQIMLSGLRIAMEGMTKFLQAITMALKGDTTLTGAFKKFFGKAGNAGSSLFLDMWFQISKQLGKASKDLWIAVKGLLEVLWDKLKTWFFNLDWGKIFQKMKPAILGSLGILFGPAIIKGVISFATQMFLTSLTAGFTNAAGKVPWGQILMSAAKTSLVTAAIALAVSIVYQLHKAYQEISEYHSELENQIKGLDKIYKDRGKVLVESLNAEGIELKIIEDIRNSDVSLMGKKIELLKQEKGLTAEVLETLRQTTKLDVQKQVALLDKEMEKLTANLIEQKDAQKIGSGLVGGGPKANLLGDLRLEMMKGDRKRALEQLTKIDKEFNKSIAGAQKDEAKKLEQGTKTPSKVMNLFEIESIVDDAKKFSAKEILKAEKQFKAAKEAILKPGGLKTLMADIINSFQDFDMEKFNKTAEIITNIAIIPQALASIGKTNVKADVVVDRIAAIISKIDSDAASGRFLLSPDAINGLTTIAIQKTVAENGLNSIHDIISLFGDINEGSKPISGKTSDLPVVKAIRGMITAANDIDKSFANINTINLKPKLENLSRALGLKGSDKFTIESEKLKVNVDIKVELDPNKMVDAALDTGRIMRSTRIGRS